MPTLQNIQVLLRSRPLDIPQSENFELVESDVPDLQPGQILIRNLFVSVEPAMRGWVSAVHNYLEPVALGTVMRSLATGRVEASMCPDYPAGALVTGLFGWQKYAVVGVDAIHRTLEDNGLPLSTSLGVLGINGYTAHYGMIEVGEPRSGNTVVVSTAAGAVGSCAGQIAKLLGCRVVGITGGEIKRQLCLGTFGFDDAIDYKRADFGNRLAQACNGGVDVYFDNTSGPISDAVLQHLNVGGRVVVCGTASVAAWDPWPNGPRSERHLLVKRARMQGFVVSDHKDHYAKAQADLEVWLRAGRLKYLEDVLRGLQSAPDAIAGLYRGENLGKRLIEVE